MEGQEHIMEMQSVSGASLPAVMKSLPGAVTPEKETPLNIEDRLEQLGNEKAGLEDKLVNYASGQKQNAKIYKITRTAALAGGAVFITGAIMASMVPFVAGAAVGALTYIASGYFKGRTEWFTRETGTVAADYQNVQKEYEATEKLVLKSKAEIHDLAKGLEASTRGEDVVDDDDFVYIDGIKLKKKMNHISDIVDNLFGKLPGKR
jgi:hypothetical protein